LFVGLSNNSTTNMSDQTSSAASSTMNTPTEEDIALFEKLMSDGKRNYVCNQPQLALDCFVQLCEKLSKYYGQESSKCMEAYLYYGKTLLEIARLESGVFGQAIKDTAEDDADSDVEDVTESTNGAKEPIANGVLVNGNHAAENGKTPVTGASVNTNGATNGLPKEGDEDVNGDDEDGGEEEVTNMELAWEMFELVTVICKRQLETEVVTDAKKIKYSLAEAKNGLAQVSLETEQYEEAVRDFTETLGIYKEVLESANDRIVAETHYNIALAYSFDKKFAEAIEEFKNAADVLKSRVHDLEGKVKESEEKGSKTEKAPPELDEWKKEIVELNALIEEEMMTRIEDAKESLSLLEQSIKTVKSAASEMFSAFGGTTNSFDDGFGDAAGFDSPAFTGETAVNDCTAKIVSLKRKTDDVATPVAVKK